MSEIREIIKAELAKNGLITFARFMEIALYCPNFGYYERPATAPGREGDFYTSVSAGPFFGQLLAHKFADWLADLKSGPVQIMEAGAHNGQLALDLLRELKKRHAEIYDRLEYWIQEPSAVRKTFQQTTLKEFAGKVRWFESWDEFSDGIRGVIVSNELLDAMPVHRLGWDAKAKRWFEWGVELMGDEFLWKRLIEKNDWNAQYFCLGEAGEPRESLTELFNALPDGFTTEVNPLATRWWSEAAKSLRAGRLITFDYGITGDEFFSPERREGTLRAYHKHQLSGDVLARVGEQDITASVNFSAIIQAGEAAGLKTEKFTDQARFFTGLVMDLCTKNPELEKWITSNSRQFQTLIHPEHLGKSFKVLIQQR